MRQLNAGAFFHIHSGCHCWQSPDRIYLSTVDIRLHSTHIEMWQFKLISIVC